MSTGPDADVIREIDRRVDAAIRKNTRLEQIITWVLLALFAVGLGLILYAAWVGRWEFLVTGGLAELAIVLPIRKLVELRKWNILLEILPQYLRLADTQQAKALAVELIQRLIQQV